MNSRIAVLPILSAIALCACAYHPALIRSDDDYRISGTRADALQEPWGITALPDGMLLSDDWAAQQTTSKDPKNFVLLFKQVREDGLVSIGASMLPDNDLKKSLPTLAERVINGIRLTAPGLSLGTETPPSPVIVDGAEAQEAVYSIRRPADYAPVRRIYLAVMKPFATHQWFMIMYASAPGQFEASIEEVHAFVRRFHFDSAKVPMSPGVGAPAKKPDAPTPDIKPTTPHHTPEGVALSG